MRLRADLCLVSKLYKIFWFQIAYTLYTGLNYVLIIGEFCFRVILNKQFKIVLYSLVSQRM